MIRDLIAAAGARLGVTDVDYRDVVLHLNGDGVHGSKNNSYYDSGTSNLPMTPAGSIAQGSVSPFSPNGWGAEFVGGTTNSVEIAHNTALDIWVGEFTIEMFVNLAVMPPDNCGLICKAPNTGVSSWAAGWNLQVFGGYLNVNTPGDVRLFSGQSAQVPLHQWVHLALVKSGTTVSLFQGGQRIATIINSNSYSNTSDSVFLGTDRVLSGNKLHGLMSNVRMVKRALYDPTQTSLTVPTSKLTAVADTVLLTLQDNRFKDNSVNNFTVRQWWEARIVAKSPFPRTSAYVPTIHDGSFLHDHTNTRSYVGTTSWSVLALGTGDLGLEGFVYLTSVAGPQRFFSMGQTGIDALYLGIGSSGLLEGGMQNTYITASLPAGFVNQWRHLALTKAGGIARLFIDGVQVASAANSANIVNYGLSVGAINADNYNVKGFTSGFHVIKGWYKYNANFAPPEARIPTIYESSLLLRGIGAAIYDQSCTHNITTVGPAMVSTSYKKNGTGCLWFDGPGSYLIIHDRPEGRIGVRPFTLAFWFFQPSGVPNAVRGLLGKPGASVTINTSRNLVLDNFGASVSALPFDQWVHVALVREGLGTNQTKLYINGFLDVTGTFPLDWSAAGNSYLGENYNLTCPFIGALDDVILIRKAVYLAPFTPPPQAYASM